MDFEQRKDIAIRLLLITQRFYQVGNLIQEYQNNQKNIEIKATELVFNIIQYYELCNLSINNFIDDCLANIQYLSDDNETINYVIDSVVKYNVEYLYDNIAKLLNTNIDMSLEEIKLLFNIYIDNLLMYTLFIMATSEIELPDVLLDLNIIQKKEDINKWI